MAGDLSGEDTFVPLPRRPAPRARGTPRHRIGPLRTVADAADHPVLSGIRSGAVSGLIIVAVIGLPVLLILSAKTPPQAAFAPPARVWAAGAEAPLQARAEPGPIAAAPPVPSPAPIPEPPRGRVGEGRPPLSLDLIPVLDAEGAVLALDEPPAPGARSVRPNRPTVQRAARTP